MIEFHFFTCSCPALPTPFVEEAIFTPFYASSPFVTWVYFWALCSVPLAYVPVLMPVPGRKISDIPHSYILTDMSPKARYIKERINKWDLIKLKSFCIVRENSIKMKKEPSIWENIFANDTSDKGLISKIYKELTQLHSKKTSNPIKKWAKYTNRHFSKEDVQRAQRHMKICSASLAIREMQIETTMRYHLTPVRIAVINKSTNTKCRRGYRQKGTLVHCWWECRLV